MEIKNSEGKLIHKSDDYPHLSDLDLGAEFYLGGYPTFRLQ
jgi:hypothetical protein